ncbi:uncharacterized protein ATC70_012675 [Mucor velutinosus]|uniref:Uncharacterized protein n=1 Tax=Mucor velutinosus TaxID=708070 RepID=A0AAN7HR96_9FUNG|nr:hypothetical protein ATC70_012675 [Mucor velutinosus]
MHNPYLNGIDVNENAPQINQQIPQTSNLDQHDPYRPAPSTTRRNEKHVLYIDDYTTEEDHPPSYSKAQEQGQEEAYHSSDVDMRAPARGFPASTPDAIPLDPYHAQLPSEPETAPLMETDSDRHSPPTAPLSDRIEVCVYNPLDRSRRVRHCSVTRFILAFAVFVVGVILMATALATIKCYNDGCMDDVDCERCENTTKKGIQAAGFSFFILVSLCIIWRFIKYAVL